LLVCSALFAIAAGKHFSLSPQAKERKGKVRGIGTKKNIDVASWIHGFADS